MHFSVTVEKFADTVFEFTLKAKVNENTFMEFQCDFKEKYPGLSETAIEKLLLF